MEASISGKFTVKIALILIVLHSYSFHAKAQLNESDTASFQLSAGITGALQRGNVELLIIRGKFDLVSNSNKDLVFKSQNNSLYQEFSGFKADNDINSRNYLYFKSFRKYYPFAMFYLQTNYRRKIKSRVFGGAGYTWQVIQKPKTNLKLSGSVVYENSVFRSDQFKESFYNGSNSIPIWRGTVYLAGWHRLYDQKFRLFFTAYWQPGIEEVPNNRASLDIGFDLPVWKGLSAAAHYTYTYEQVVVSNVLQVDSILTFGLSYQLKKN